MNRVDDINLSFDIFTTCWVACRLHEPSTWRARDHHGKDHGRRGACCHTGRRGVSSSYRSSRRLSSYRSSRRLSSYRSSRRLSSYRSSRRLSSYRSSYRSSRRRLGSKRPGGASPEPSRRGSYLSLRALSSSSRRFSSSSCSAARRGHVPPPRCAHAPPARRQHELRLQSVEGDERKPCGEQSHAQRGEGPAIH